VFTRAIAAAAQGRLRRALGLFLSARLYFHENHRKFSGGRQRSRPLSPRRMFHVCPYGNEILHDRITCHSEKCTASPWGVYECGLGELLGRAAALRRPRPRPAGGSFWMHPACDRICDTNESEGARKDSGAGTRRAAAAQRPYPAKLPDSASRNSVQ